MGTILRSKQLIMILILYNEKVYNLYDILCEKQFKNIFNLKF